MDSEMEFLYYQEVKEISEDLLNFIDLMEYAEARNNNIDYVIARLQELKVPVDKKQSK